MNALDLLYEVYERGGEVQVDGARVTLSAPRGAVDDSLKARLREHKPDLILALRLKRFCEGLFVGPAEVLSTISDDPERSWDHVQVVALGMHQGRQMDHGIVPAGWTAESKCKRCGPAPVPPDDAGGSIVWCPWCFHPEGLRKLREAGP